MCFGEILLCYKNICLWFYNKRFCNKKGGLFVPDPVLSRYLGFAALLQPVFKAGFENARLQWYNWWSQEAGTHSALELCFSSFNVHLNCLGTLLKYRFWVWAWGSAFVTWSQLILVLLTFHPLDPSFLFLWPAFLFLDVSDTCSHLVDTSIHHWDSSATL